MTKYSFSSTPKRSASPAPPQQSRPFDLDHQMRLFMVEKRSAGLHTQLSPLPTHSRTPSYNTQKQLPMPPSPPRKLLRLTSKSSKRLNANSTPITATYFNSSGRAVSRTEIRPVPHPSRGGNVAGASSSAPSLVSPGEMKRYLDSRQKRPSSFIAPETPNDVFWTALMSPEMALPPRTWTSPENSPLLPPPRGGRGSPELRIIPPPIHISSPRRPLASPVKRRGTPQLRTKTSEIFESVLGIYPSTKKHTQARSNPDILTTHMANGISPRRITIDSIERPPRTPPPPPTPAKSRAQRERARLPTTPAVPPIPTTTPVGYVAELVGSEVEFPPVELMGDVEFPIIIAPVPQKKRRVKASKIKSKVKQRPTLEPHSPEGKELYSRLPLPDAPQSTTPPYSPLLRSCGSSPVLEVDFDSFDDGLVEWFNNFNWSEASQLSPAHSTSSSEKTDTPKTATLRIPPTPGSPTSNEFPHDTRASVLDPDNAVVTNEPSPKLPVDTSFLSLSPGVPQESALLSPVFPVSPRLTSYYGARASFASSVGDAFRFDEDEGKDGLSDVDERYEEELDVDELYGFSRDGDESESEEVGLIPDRTSLDSRLEFEIEMMLNGSYGGGSPDDWRDGVYSPDSPEQEEDRYWEEREGEIMVGLDIEEEWGSRPKTRYIAGRNSAIEGDVVFCLRGVDSM